MTGAPWTGPWVARFRNGPQRGEQRTWAVGPIWREIVVAPLPHRSRWFLCGGDGIPPAKGGSEPWPNEVRYRLASTKLSRGFDEPMMVAIYALQR